QIRTAKHKNAIYSALIPNEAKAFFHLDSLQVVEFTAGYTAIELFAAY
ncbi:hypothetical protein JX852_004980, partial [Escherichia coli]|nr:hypothetical protein [Escherichia coli]